jgi:hypothetical protein
MGPGSDSHQSLREGPPTRRERASDTHPIFDREAHRAPAQ